MEKTAVARSESIWQLPMFWVFWGVRFGVTAGFNVLGIVLAWQMYDLTHEPLDLGLVGLLQFLPRLVLALFVGSILDRVSRRGVLFCSALLQLCIVLGLLINSTLTLFTITPWLIMVLSVMIGVCRSFDLPALQTILPSVVPEKMLSSAIAGAAMATHVAVIGAPALGGFLYGLSATYSYLWVSLCYGVSCVLLIFLHVTPYQKEQGKVSLASLMLGIRYIRHHKVLLGAISLDLFAVLLGGAVALLPIFAKDILHVNEFGLGLLRGAPAVGALCMSLYLTHFPIKQRAGLIMFAGVAVFSVATIVFGLSTNLLISLFALFVVGAADMISVIVRGNLVQLETPESMRGRVSAVNSLFIGASNQLGEFESGFSAHYFGVIPAVVLGGIGSLFVTLMWMVWFPALRKRDAL